MTEKNTCTPKPNARKVSNVTPDKIQTRARQSLPQSDPHPGVTTSVLSVAGGITGHEVIRLDWLRCAARFRRYVDKRGANDCWPWTGARTADGYGRLQIAGLSERAARVAWALHTRCMPGKWLVLHRCDNPPCVNPDHLFLGTIQDNNADAKAKGRIAYGELNGRAKLTDGDVTVIRALLDDGVPSKAVAHMYSISKSQVNKIRCLATRGHVAPANDVSTNAASCAHGGLGHLTPTRARSALAVVLRMYATPIRKLVRR